MSYEEATKNHDRGVICHGLIILLILENKSFLRATNFEDGLYNFYMQHKNNSKNNKKFKIVKIVSTTSLCMILVKTIDTNKIKTNIYDFKMKKTGLIYFKSNKKFKFSLYIDIKLT